MNNLFASMQHSLSSDPGGEIPDSVQDRPGPHPRPPGRAQPSLAQEAVRFFIKELVLTTGTQLGRPP